jgi:hypothetical protein
MDLELNGLRHGLSRVQGYSGPIPPGKTPRRDHDASAPARMSISRSTIRSMPSPPARSKKTAERNQSEWLSGIDATLTALEIRAPEFCTSLERASKV